MTTAQSKRARWHATGGFEASQAQFRDAAHAMIKAGSLAKLSMRSLALEVGASAMTSYRYYTDKEALVADVRRQIWQEFVTMLAAAVDGTQDVQERFCAMALAYLDYAVQHEHEYRLMFEGPRPQSITDASVNQLDSVAWTFLRNLVLQISGSDDDAYLSHQCHLIWSSLHGLATLHHAGRLSLEGRIEDVGPPVIALLLKSICANTALPTG